jgi:hypothetical protein
VYDLIVFDDGSGSSLYAAGEFLTADGQTVNNVARWDGIDWHPVAGANGVAGVMGGQAKVLEVFDDGTGPALYTGGQFIEAGGVEANRIARWNGAEWSGLESAGWNGISDGSSFGTVEALAIFDDGSGASLYVGGAFARAGAFITYNLARWDGEEWSRVPDTPFRNIGGNWITSIETLNSGDGDVLYIGGQFSQTGGFIFQNLARWDGAEWSTVAPLEEPSSVGVNARVEAMLSVVNDDGDESLLVGGNFWRAASTSVNGIGVWDGEAWATLVGPGSEGLTGSDASSFGACQSIVQFDDGSGPSLYATGNFGRAGGVVANHVAKWDGTTWSELRSESVTAGLTEGMGTIEGSALAVFDAGNGPELYVGGKFERAGGMEVGNLAKWDGERWRRVNESPSTIRYGFVRAMTVFDDGSGPALYVAGTFTHAESTLVNYIARWDGTAWSALTTEGGGGLSRGVNGPVFALAVYDDGSGPALYVGGAFSMAGGMPAQRVAKWDGSSWSTLGPPLGQGVGGFVHSLAVHDDGSGPSLYVGGRFETAGGTPSNGGITVKSVAQWDGESWHALTGSTGTGVAGPGNSTGVYSLVSHDSGSGPLLFVGGNFATAGGLQANNIAAWDGIEWLEVASDGGVGVDGPTYSLASVDIGTGPMLIAGGDFLSDGTNSLRHIAIWEGCTATPCPGDVTGDNAIDLADLNLVLANFGQATDAGDATGDGEVNKADLNAVLAAFGTLCQ